MPRRNIYGLILICIFSLACYFQAQHNRFGRTAAEALDQISRRYFEPVDDAKLLEAAVNGMIHHLETEHKDDHSEYISPDQEREFDQSINRCLEGIGIRVLLDPKTKELLVVSPLVGSPAYEAGIRAGDRILKIDGRSTQGMSLKDSLAAMHGEAGKAVTLVILHEGEKQPIELRVVRRLVQDETVLGDVRNTDGSWNFFLPGHDRIGYVRLTGFAENEEKKTINDLIAALEWLTAHGMRGLILDLRDNPGGLLTTATEVCDLFLPPLPAPAKGAVNKAEGIGSNVIVTTRGRDQRIRRVVEASGNGPFTTIPMVVLVNQYSASASEIVAACLQDHHRALIVGQRSYGKGTVQEVTDLDGHGKLKLTVASYWRPSGKNIHRHHGDSPNDDWGVQPDPGCKVVVRDEELNRYRRWRQDRDVVRGSGEKNHPAEPFVDRQLLKAVECLEGKATAKTALPQAASASRPQGKTNR